MKRNIAAGRSALERVKERILKPGVRIRTAKGVPLFHADPKNPGKLVRVLDGRRERGSFVNGEFQVHP
ncbi:MAG: hypothetical protein HY791_00830 [Deltaproteobacteria bacterium]|nr:hypothetical protein [Deltaproteobacteria bacterium]